MTTTKAYFKEEGRDELLNILMSCSDMFFYEKVSKLPFPATSELVRIYTDAFNAKLGDVDSVFLVFEDELPVGCAVIEETVYGSTEEPVHEVNVFIKEAFRGVGIGSLLMSDVVKEYRTLIGNFHDERSTGFFMKHNVDTNSPYCKQAMAS